MLTFMNNVKGSISGFYEIIKITAQTKTSIFKYYILSLLNSIAVRVLLVAVLASVYFVLFISKIEDLRKFLLDGRDATGIVTSKNSVDLLGENESSFLYDLAGFDNINCDVVINEGEDIKVKCIYVAFDL